jgi:hypothetical protein
MLVATTAIAGVQLFQAVRIRKVEMWAIPAQGGLPTSVSVEFSGVTAGIVGDQLIHTDTSMGVQPAHVSAVPSARSLASDYQVASSATAFQLTVTNAASVVVDVHFTFRGQLGVAPGAVSQALVGATVGAQYLRGLDGLAIASTTLGPEYSAAAI